MTGYPAILVVLAGRAGTGKTTLAKRIVKELGGSYIRLDAIVCPILDAGLTDDSLKAAETGYQVASELARENLALGVSVVVDGLHASHGSRDRWLHLAADVGARLKVLETRLNDAAEHRRRVEVRTGADSGYVGPSWDNIQQMTYETWDEQRSGRRLTVEMSDTEAAMAAAIRYIRGGTS